MRRADNSLPQPAQRARAARRWPGAAPPAALGGGSTFFTEQTWEQLAGSLGLSGRELQIVPRVFYDQTELAIAQDLGLSPHTIHTHFERLHRKLGIATRTGLVLHITRQHLALTSVDTCAPTSPLGMDPTPDWKCIRHEHG